MPKSRRKAREAALRALYQMEVGRTQLQASLSEMKANADLSPDLMNFAEELVAGVHSHQAFLDDALASRVQEYDFERVAAVDRNLLRIAAYELYYCPSIPPAVTLNEAIELAKKYSTAESGKFVNGVLAKVLLDSPKARWPEGAKRPEQEEPPEAEPLPEVETIEADSDQLKELSRIGKWQLRSDGED